MTFWELNAMFLGSGLGVLALAALLGRVRARHVAAIGAAVLALWVLTAVFDNVMIASGLFDYGHQRLGGVYLGLAPLEDFAYPLGSALLLPALWLILTPRSSRFRAEDRGRGTTTSSGTERAE